MTFYHDFRDPARRPACAEAVPGRGLQGHGRRPRWPIPRSAPSWASTGTSTTPMAGHAGAGVLPGPLRLRPVGDGRRPLVGRLDTAKFDAIVGGLNDEGLDSPRRAQPGPLAPRRWPAAIRPRPGARRDLTLVRNGSRGMVWLEPLAEVEIDGIRHAFGPMTPECAGAVVRSAAHPKALGPTEDLPWMKAQTRLTFARVGVIDPLSLADYRSHGGLAGLTAPGHGRRRRRAEVTDSGLRGRGGAGFPTGIKWKTVRCAAGDAQIHRLQRRRGRQRHLRRPHADGGRPLHPDRGHGDRRPGLLGDQGLHLFRSEYPDAIRDGRGVAHRPGEGLIGVLGSGRGLSTWKSASVPAPMSAARRPPC
jgi:hypothetical protein